MFDLVSLIKTGGYIGIFLIVFTESGLLIGLFLPGDSLLFTAGLLASRGYVRILSLMAVAFVAAVLGDSTGYYLGRRFGPKVFQREDSWFFKRRYVDETAAYFEKHGAKTIVLARFVPVVRTLAPLMAGVGRMHYRTFVLYNVAGGAAWALGLPALGYALGDTIPDIDRYLLPIIIFIVLASIAPAVHQVLQDPQRRRELSAWIRGRFRR
jgi:membrane-associated protein